MSLDYIDPTTPPPVDWTGAIFPEPMLYRLAPLWLALLVLAVLGLLFYRQRLMDARSEARQAPRIIFRAIRAAIDRALYATGPATIPAGQTVIDAMTLYLGPILSFSAELKGPLGRLEQAVAGKAEPDGRPHAHPADHARAEANHSTVVVTTGGQEHALTADRMVQIVGPAQVSVTEAPRHQPADGHDSPARIMSVHEQAAAVRYALERLHEAWTADAVEPRLKAMHAALSIREAKGARSGREPSRRRAQAPSRRPARATNARAGTRT